MITITARMKIIRSIFCSLSLIKGFLEERFFVLALLRVIITMHAFKWFKLEGRWLSDNDFDAGR